MDLHHAVLELGARERVQRPERLVEQQHLGLHRQRPGEAHPLLHAAGDLVGPLVLGVVHPDQRQVASVQSWRSARLFCRGRPCRPPAGRSVDLSQGSSEWFWNTTARSGPGASTSRPSRITAARGRRHEPGHHVEQRGLAAAGMADDGDELALRRRQAESSSTSLRPAPGRRRRRGGRCRDRLAMGVLPQPTRRGREWPSQRHQAVEARSRPGRHRPGPR